NIADGSVGSPHVRVGHRQASIPKALIASRSGLFSFQPADDLFSLREKVMVIRANGSHPPGCLWQSKRRCRLSGF
ncbi:hypothetical protein, partial [Microbulbifer magnicolonia]|uniref:hypothetical protein n=1 Tax=Microbulbifer magnicolonia TaxID=3109744 RepID=UPI002B407398